MKHSIAILALALSIGCGDDDDNEEAIPVEEGPSVARLWNEALLSAIRVDRARPNVHARNLYHSSALMFDAWAVFDVQARPVFLGSTLGGEACAFDEAQRNRFRELEDSDAARVEAISYGMFRLLSHRFQNSPGAGQSQQVFTELHERLGFNPNRMSRDLATNAPAALGNYLATCIITYGLTDGSNEAGDFANLQYQPINPSLDPTASGNPQIIDPDRWQPLNLDNFVDQSGVPATTIPDFLGAEWGAVDTFALSAGETRSRDGIDFVLHLDPGTPPMLGGNDTESELYRWGHALVAQWSAFLDPTIDAQFDISPGNLGNGAALPENFADYPSFYLADGTQTRSGRDMNPSTGEPYAPNFVPQGDYGRVIAEYWADGPDSETPPGHWFSIANKQVTDHPNFVRVDPFSGAQIGALEWDVKLYLALGGAMHDAAIAAWGAKGFYDYVRPISAIRYMGDRGQSSDPSGPSYDPEGLPLIDGVIEVVQAGDPLAASNGQNVGSIKIRTWRGPDFIDDPATEIAGVDWILSDNWWPYQRPNFVTPPFAGYVSGHSTFSRAAADVLASMTGSEFFPGGLAEVEIPANEFLVFEQGPSVDVTLQWATYVDAANESALSRIYGGIHPPIDDATGRIMGSGVAEAAIARTRAQVTGSP
ncbi:MAG: vanadium-dependent haloperoxidase [Myxococcota bacterium]